MNALRQFADIGHKHAAGRRFRHIKAVTVGATDGDIGAARSRTGFDLRHQLPIRSEHEHMSERGVSDKQAARFVDSQSVGPAGAEHRTEAAYLRDVAASHERQTPNRVVPRHRHKQHGFAGIEHQAVRTDAGVDQTVETSCARKPIDPPGWIMQPGLALVGEIDVAVRGDVEIVASFEGFGIARGQDRS